MKTDDLSPWQHHHVFDQSNPMAERGTRAVMMITAVAMVVETWLDPVMGIVGAGLVAYWAKGLIADTSRVLLDREMDHPVVDEIREAIEGGSAAYVTRLTDLHVWRVGKQAFACALSVVTNDHDLSPRQLRERLAVHEEIVHATIEIHYLTETRVAAAHSI